MPARRDALQPGLGRIQPAAMGQAPRGFDRQQETLGQPVPPCAERRWPGPAVEAAVELHRAEGCRIAGQPVTGRKPCGVQLRVPVIITPPRRADPDHYRCPSATRPDATLTDLAVKGIAAEPPGRPGGADGPQTSWITDPEGYRIELVQWPAALTASSAPASPKPADRLIRQPLFHRDHDCRVHPRPPARRSLPNLGRAMVTHSHGSAEARVAISITSGSVIDAVSGAERTDRPGMSEEPIATQCCVPSRRILVASSTPAAVAGLRVTWPGGLACRAR